ncbi:hypothetical protein AB0A71_23635 [Kitasatospora aureofaciens]|uniref:hypothetical protein n=1 Tax=Kitasatospora aureofaciens TaxID=1894 RepID=UPI0033C1B85D
MPFQFLQVVVDLLSGQLQAAGRHGGRAGLGQGGEDPGPDRVQGGFGRGGLFDHGDVQHRSSVIRQKSVKEKRLSAARPAEDYRAFDAPATERNGVGALRRT